MDKAYSEQHSRPFQHYGTTAAPKHKRSHNTKPSKPDVKFKLQVIQLEHGVESRCWCRRAFGNRLIGSRNIFPSSLHEKKKARRPSNSDPESASIMGPYAEFEESAASGIGWQT